MSDITAQPLPAKWKERLDLSGRSECELYEDAQSVGKSPYANAIRMALLDLGASAVFCVQDLPTVVIVVLDEYESRRVIDLHGALWNQGLAMLLLVLSGDTIRAFSLARVPYRHDQEFNRRCLVRELSALTDALAVRNLIYGAESGRLWERHADFFRPRERIDQVLLNNLSESHKALCHEDLSTDAAQALLIQTMFVAYLEDREIIRSDDFRSASRDSSETFLELLESQDPNALYRLFRQLHKDFNGDLFVAPCSFDMEGPPPKVLSAHLQILARFRSGREEISDGASQLRFWGYNFKYIPIELVSAVYDRFLGEQQEERKKRGAYYTPMFLADTVISAVWDDLPNRVREQGVVLDPACGSGIFLVRSFQYLCEFWRENHKSRTIRWDSLLSILSRLHGWDVNAKAVRVAVFSLYVALFHEVKPPEIRALIDRGRVLPDLWNQTLRTQDFFGVSHDEVRAHVIVGNPPWLSRKGTNRASVEWCESRGVPMPAREDAWAFVWKSLQHLEKHGVAGFLLPAMGFLHNHAEGTVKARNLLMHKARIHRIVNFSDMRFQLFDGAVRPAALIVFGLSDVTTPDYRFDYWTPKADINLKIRRAITLPRIDKRAISTLQAKEDPFVFKRRLWISDPESKLFSYLAELPKLGDLVTKYQTAFHRMQSFEDQWLVGNGFKPVSKERLGEADYQSQYSEVVTRTRYLPIKSFRPLAQYTQQLRVFDQEPKGLVHRRGFERGFSGPRVLVPRGVITGASRLRASYLEEPLTFENIILSISVPSTDAQRAKLLTALLNSKLLYWYAFHGTASFGSDRPEIPQAELLRLPFPAPTDIQNSNASKSAAEALVSVIDEAMMSPPESLVLRPLDSGIFEELDSHCYSYFGLGEEEIALVEDAVEHLIPCVQPRRGSSLELWRLPSRADRQAYADTLARTMSQWLDEKVCINVILEARNDDLALLHLQLVERATEMEYREKENRAIGEALKRLGQQIKVHLPGNFHLVPDFRLFADKSLFLVKPLQRRFWLRSAAVADADAMALELHDSASYSQPDLPA